MSTRIPSPTDSTRLRPHPASGGHRHQIGSYSNVRTVQLVCCFLVRRVVWLFVVVVAAAAAAVVDPVQGNHSCFVFVSCFPSFSYSFHSLLFASLTPDISPSRFRPFCCWLGSSCFRTSPHSSYPSFYSLVALRTLQYFSLFLSLYVFETIKTIRWRRSHRFVSCFYRAKRRAIHPFISTTGQQKQQQRGTS